MFRLKANKTSLYKLVDTYEDLPPMLRVTITKSIPGAGLVVEMDGRGRPAVCGVL